MGGGGAVSSGNLVVTRNYGMAGPSGCSSNADGKKETSYLGGCNSNPKSLEHEAG